MKHLHQHPWRMVVGLLWVGFALRLFGLAQQPLWLDELFSTAFAAGMSPETLGHIMVSDVHPPIYYIQLHFWIKVVGTSDVALRFNGVLIGMLSIASLYRVIRYLLHQEIGVLAAVFLTVSAAALFYEQQLRMYHWQILFVIWVWFALHVLLMQPHIFRHRLAYLGLSLAFLYSQGAAFLIFFSTTCYTLLWLGQDIAQRRAAFLRWLQYQFLLVVLYIPWLFLAANMGVSHVQTPDLFALAQTMTEIFLGYYNGYAAGMMWIVLIISLALTAAAIFDRTRQTAILAFGVVPMLAGFFISHLIRPIWITRSMVFALPFWLLALAYGVHDLQNMLRSSRWRYLPASLAIAALFMGTFLQQNSSRDQWRLQAVVDTLSPQFQAGDHVLFPAEIIFWFWGWYALPPGSIQPRITTSVISADHIEFGHIAGRSLNTILQPGETYWFIWDEVFPWDGINACLSNLSLDETMQIQQMMIRHVRVADTATMPLCRIE